MGGGGCTHLPTMASLQPNPPISDPHEEGWYSDQEKNLSDLSWCRKEWRQHLNAILKITRCNCNASYCRTSAMLCSSIPCTEFCGCNHNGCNSKWERVISDFEEWLWLSGWQRVEMVSSNLDTCISILYFLFKYPLSFRRAFQFS